MDDTEASNLDTATDIKMLAIKKTFYEINIEMENVEDTEDVNNNPEYYSLWRNEFREIEIDELWPNLFYTRNYGHCYAQTMRIAKISLVIVIDQALYLRQEYLLANGLGAAYEYYHKKIHGVNNTNTCYRYGSDVETMDVTLNQCAFNSFQVNLETLQRMAHVLIKAKVTGARALIIDYNDNNQRSLVLAVAALIFQKGSTTFHDALKILYEMKSIQMYLNPYYTNLLYAFEEMIETKKSENDNTWQVQDPVMNNTLTYKK